MSFKVNLNDSLKQFSELKKLPQNIIDQAYDYFVKATPIRSGNARNNTKLQKTSIVADYVYAERLDNGYSKQAPRGMTEPTEKKLQQLLDAEVKKIG